MLLESKVPGSKVKLADFGLAVECEKNHKEYFGERTRAGGERREERDGCAWKEEREREREREKEREREGWLCVEGRERERERDGSVLLHTCLRELALGGDEM